MAFALTSIPASNVPVVDGKGAAPLLAPNLFAPNPFDTLGAGLNFSSFLGAAGRALDTAPQPAVATQDTTTSPDDAFSALLQLPDQDAADLDKVDAIDQSVIVAAIILPVVPVQQQEVPTGEGLGDEIPTDETSELPEIAPIAASADAQSAGTPIDVPLATNTDTPSATTENKNAPVDVPVSWFTANALLNLSRGESGKTGAGNDTQEITKQTLNAVKGVMKDITQTVDVAQIIPLEKLLPSLAQALAKTDSKNNDGTDDDAAPTSDAPQDATATPDIWGLIASALKPFSPAEQDAAKTSGKDQVADAVAALPRASTPAPQAGIEFKMPSKASLLGVDEKDDEKNKKAGTRDTKNTSADAVPQAPVATQPQQTTAVRHTADAFAIKAMGVEGDADFTQSDSSKDNSQAGTSQSVDQRAAAIEAAASKDNKVDPSFLKLVKASSAHDHISSPGDQVLVSIRQAFDSSTQGDKIRVQLSPHDLGGVDITLTMKGDEISHISILAEKAETLDMLQKDGRFLERSLQESGLKADSGSLQFGLKGEQGSGAQFSDNEGKGGRNSNLPYDGKPSKAEEDPAALGWKNVGGTEVLMATTGINIKV